MRPFVQEPRVEEQEPAVDARGFTEAQWAVLDASLWFMVIGVLVTAFVIGVVVFCGSGPWY